MKIRRIENKMKKCFTVLMVSSVTIVAAALPGCGNSDKTQGKPPAPSLADAKNPDNMKKLAERALPKGDKNRPLDDYKIIDSGNQVMFLFYGLLNLPLDYEKIAQAYSRDYRDTNDSFKKQDILNALKPRIDREVGAAKGATYIRMDIDQSQLNNYDFDKKGFPIGEFADSSSYRYFNDNSSYTLGFTNSADFALLKVADQEKARTIESLRSKYARLKLRIYAFAQDADPNDHRVKLQILKCQLYGPQGELLAEM